MEKAARACQGGSKVSTRAPPTTRNPQSLAPQPSPEEKGLGKQCDPGKRQKQPSRSSHHVSDSEENVQSRIEKLQKNIWEKLKQKKRELRCRSSSHPKLRKTSQNGRRNLEALRKKTVKSPGQEKAQGGPQASQEKWKTLELTSRP